MSTTVRVFCDFDGTIAPVDIGNQLFRTFAGERAVQIVQGYLNGTVTARECLRQECEAVEDIRPQEFASFIDNCTLDPHFARFVDFCETHHIPLTILSDGLDVYVERLLQKHSLGRLAFFANHAEFVRDGVKTKLTVSFPHTDSECDLCGNCKRNHMLVGSGDDDFVAYVGDGMSDRCPVRYADLVFAKGQLIGFCQAANISYYEYRDFRDVESRLNTVLTQRRLRKRREAMMAGRAVFQQG